MTITKFLLARIEEDEAVARAAAESNPDSKSYGGVNPGLAGEQWTSDDGGMVHSIHGCLWDCEGSDTLCTTGEVAAHMARHDPARVLAECAAKRAILGYWNICTNEEILQSLASIYSSHPDYQQEWEL